MKTESEMIEDEPVAEEAREAELGGVGQTPQSSISLRIPRRAPVMSDVVYGPESVLRLPSLLTAFSRLPLAALPSFSSLFTHRLPLPPSRRFAVMQ